MLAKNLTPAFVKLFPIAGPKVASYGQIIAFSVSLLGFGGFWLLQGDTGASMVALLGS
jgi:hypothetical protein